MKPTKVQQEIINQLPNKNWVCEYGEFNLRLDCYYHPYGGTNHIFLSIERDGKIKLFGGEFATRFLSVEESKKAIKKFGNFPHTYIKDGLNKYLMYKNDKRVKLKSCPVYSLEHLKEKFKGDWRVPTNNHSATPYYVLAFSNYNYIYYYYLTNEFHSSINKFMTEKAVQKEIKLHSKELLNFK